MDIVLILLGVIFIILGIIGCILPVLPGPILAWFSLLLLDWTDRFEVSSETIWTTLAVVVVVHMLDFVIPAMGTKKFGGSKYGVIGATLGLLIGLVAPIPFGVIVGPFLGALIGELIKQKQSDRAIKAAIGSLVGFVLSTGLKLAVTLYLAYVFFSQALLIFKG